VELSASNAYRMLIAYDGSRYHGWQAQPKLATVEGELVRALAALTGERPVIRAAGRTDAGAHAHGQVVSFRLIRAWDPAALGGGCNDRLPDDIGVLETAAVDSRFDPRWQAWRRTYRYLIRDSAAPAPVGRQYEWRIPGLLELMPMRQAARSLVGTHDFSAFGRSPLAGGSTVRTVDRAEVERQGGLVSVEIRADAFLRGMMRNFAGALAAVGGGRVSVAEVGRALAEPGVKPAAWPTAPAQGLHQWQVDYRVDGAEVLA
jgi:tRNA pseudouridine38-40 synthase